LKLAICLLMDYLEMDRTIDFALSLWGDGGNL
jgi:hypothetical protein